jgi:hypothetical protein
MRKNISKEEARTLLLKFLLQKGILPLYFANVMDQKHYPSTELLTRKERIKQISFNIIDKQNNSMKTTGALKEVEVNESNSGIMTNYNNFNNNNNNKTILNTQNMSNYNNVGRRKSKTMKEIMLKIEDYMFYFGKKTASDLFKIFDRDANLKVGIKELADGFARMGISLNPEELDMIWKNIVGKSDKTSFGFEEFMAFYEKHKVKK